ncbi:hypothetical protein JCGZ_03848 [Jatropha curcas]|uniref:Uncharacterized protein n=1 Tax=Jatropha curcas TaxID=180498 RepID=A0A067KZM2_JATCU|nr:hypothetical protein JCGZ_03848 [Jatropha curcas]
MAAIIFQEKKELQTSTNGDTTVEERSRESPAGVELSSVSRVGGRSCLVRGKDIVERKGKEEEEKR